MPFSYNIGTAVTYSNVGKQMLRSAPGIKSKEKRYPAKVVSMKPVTIEFEGTQYPQGSKTMEFRSIFESDDSLFPRTSGGKRSKKTRKQTRKMRKGRKATYRKRR